MAVDSSAVEDAARRRFGDLLKFGGLPGCLAVRRKRVETSLDPADTSVRATLVSPCTL